MSRKKLDATYKRHRIIMPVYIPNKAGYFEHALDILKLCLDTLFATIDREEVSVTVINNDSIEEVDAILSAEFEAGRIDRYVRHRQNRGKPDPVAGEILASYETFVTVTDSDVLFLQGWIEEVEKTFATFPGTGSVSPFPSPKQHFYYTSNTWIAGAANFSLVQGAFAPETDLAQFAHSIGKPDFYDVADRRLQFALRRNGRVALIGGGHFVITLRRKAYDGFVYEPGMGGTTSGEDRIDAQIERAGYMRLSTPRAWVYHMGNVPEPWMKDTAGKVISTATIRNPASTERGTSNLSPIVRLPIARIPYMFRRCLAWPFRLYVGWRKRSERRAASKTNNVPGTGRQ